MSKQAEDKVVIRQMMIEDIHEDSLKTLNRYQEVKRVWRKEDNQWLIKPLSFTEFWDENDKAELIKEEIIPILKEGGTMFGGFIGDDLVGFALLDDHFIGRLEEYIQLIQLQVSFDHRGQGIGSMLFNACVQKARHLGVSKIYISAHSSVESKAFYDHMGCVEASWLYDKQVALEPYDCQLEYVV